jgi:hypothetical protein
MKRRKRVSLGDLVVAAFDAAGPISEDERDASYLAACAIRKLLVDAGRADLARKLADPVLVG